MSDEPKGIGELWPQKPEDFNRGQNQKSRSNQYQEKPTRELYGLHAKMPFEILTNPNLKANAKVIYGFLMVRAGVDGVTWYSQVKIAKELKVARNTVKSCLVQLQDQNLIKYVCCEGSTYFVIFYIRYHNGKSWNRHMESVPEFFRKKHKVQDWRKYIVDIKLAV